MRQTYTTDIAFAHAVRFNDAMVRAWAKRTGRMSRRGNYSYRPEDLAQEAPHIDLPTNEDRGRAELVEFIARPLEYGKAYGAYLKSERTERGIKSYITTWVGGLLATVTSLSVCGYKAVGIDGRQYYGRHNGPGMICSLRLARYADEFDVEQRTPEGWEIVCSASTWREASADVRSYRENQPEYAVRIRHRKVKQ